MSQPCLICNSRVGFVQKTAVNIFKEYTTLGRELATLLSELLEKPIDKDVFSIVICKKCYKLCMEYDCIKARLQVIKSELLSQFKTTLPKNNLDYDAFPNAQAKDPLEIKTEPVTSSKKIVLPASKLLPLPPDYVIHVDKLQSGLNFMKQPVVRLPKISSVSSLSSTLNLKVTVGSSVLTQSIKTTGQKTVAITSTTQSKPKESNSQSVSNTQVSTTQGILSLGSNMSILGSKSNGSIMSFDVDSLPKDFMSTKDTKADETGNEEEIMEIDDDYTVLHVTDKSVLIDEEEEKDSSNESEYFDVNLVPVGDDENRDDDSEDYQETIVMSGDNASILHMVRRRGQLELVVPDQDHDHQQDPEDHQDGASSNGDHHEDNDPHDSNDESQIELQVSGDEETANAIIAAAQERGGAFIKVETGEMFRVKSVKSKPANAIEIQEGAQDIMVHDGEMFKCLLCEKNKKEEETEKEETRFSSSEAASGHARQAHGARLYICSLPGCHKVMRRRVHHTRHMEEHVSKAQSSTEKGRIHECNICKKKYNSRTLLTEHMNIHSGSRPYVCSACNKAFASKYNYQAHLKTHQDRPRPFKCVQCPKSFLTQQNLTQHLKTHTGVKDFICKICGKAFGTQHNLEVHGVVHSGSKPFVCGVCSKAFARRAEVKDHMRTHTGERPFACEICGATFAQRSNLHSHKRATHLDDKRYHCTQCPKRFKRRRLLEYHVKASHTGERPLQCAACRATFVYPEHYKKHLRIHSGERPFVCEVCGKSFNSRDNRNTHRFVHSDKKPYECLVCGAGYMRKQLLYAHMNSSGHLAESIVVNQPRVQKVLDNPVPSQSIVIDASDGTAKLDTIFEQTQEIVLEANIDSKAIVTEGDTPKIFITEDKKFILQDGKSTINLVPDSEDPTLLTLQSIEGDEKSEALLQSVSVPGTEPLPLEQQAQMVASDANGSMVRLVQIQLQNGSSGWVAINQ